MWLKYRGRGWRYGDGECFSFPVLVFPLWTSLIRRSESTLTTNETTQFNPRSISKSTTYIYIYMSNSTNYAYLYSLTSWLFYFVTIKYIFSNHIWEIRKSKDISLNELASLQPLSLYLNSWGWSGKYYYICWIQVSIFGN